MSQLQRIYEQLDGQDKKLDRMLEFSARTEEHLKTLNGAVQANRRDISILKQDSWKRKGMLIALGGMATLLGAIATLWGMMGHLI